MLFRDLAPFTYELVDIKLFTQKVLLATPCCVGQGIKQTQLKHV